MAKLHIRHPVIMFMIQNTVQTATAAYTSKNSPARYASFIICAVLAWTSLSTYHDYINTTGYAGRTLAGALALSINAIFDRLIIRQWNYEDDLLSATEEEKKSLSRWDWGTKISASGRYCGTEREVANVPRFDEKNPDWMPSRSMFLVGHGAWCIGLYFLNIPGTNLVVNNNLALVSENHVPFFSRLGEVSLEEVIVRTRVALGWWIIQYAYLSFFYSVGALLAVGSNPSNLKLWRPFFGSPKTSYTIRNFWGKSWHQGMQLNVKGPSEFITHTVFRLQPGALFTRYFKIFFAFLDSGVMHIVGDYGGDVSWGQSGAIRFFCTQVLGIMLEDAAQELWRRVFGEKGKGFCRAVGYVWVLAWLVWSTPSWCFPVARTMKAEDVVLLPSALSPVFRGIWG